MIGLSVIARVFLDTKYFCILPKNDSRIFGDRVLRTIHHPNSGSYARFYCYWTPTRRKCTLNPCRPSIKRVILHLTQYPVVKCYPVNPVLKCTNVSSVSEQTAHVTALDFHFKPSLVGIMMVLLMIVNLLLAISTWRHRASRRIALLQASVHRAFESEIFHIVHHHPLL